MVEEYVKFLELMIICDILFNFNVDLITTITSMHELKDITMQIEIIKKTQGYTLGKPNERENLSKTLPFIQADTLPFR